MDKIEVQENLNQHIRFEALHSALSYALQKTLSKLTLKIFVTCYPNIDSSSLEYVRQQIIKSWQSRAELEFQKIFAEKKLKEKLDELDDIIHDGERRKKEFLIKEDKDENRNGISVNITSLTPSELSKMYIVTEKEKSLKILESELSTIQNANEELLSKMKEITQEITNNVSEYEGIMEQFKVLDDIDEDAEEKSFKRMVEWAVDEITKSN
ncbi:hypothetical protein C6P40_001666 [Pichia californica]|uniref:Uncharacterized protein n=1 Tax=Pichia californica TaxID=460514 RepID=A0A9P7BG58_9ASCO|nr:hypothetical protein C6P42_000065 [[Candida] californica]KAG0691382.1 hypothetical protein C6P40_001666 [[Candida] californica]